MFLHPKLSCPNLYVNCLCSYCACTCYARFSYRQLQVSSVCFAKVSPVPAKPNCSINLKTFVPIAPVPATPVSVIDNDKTTVPIAPVPATPVSVSDPTNAIDANCTCSCHTCLSKINATGTFSSYCTCASHTSRSNTNY